MTQYVEGYVEGGGEQGDGREPVRLRYEEHLGRLGANFRVDLGDTITVTVGPLLARSPHVVYTNVVEALLRFVMVDRGHMLLHSATISLDGVGVMLSALTDTGKTATVLRLLREHGGHFLSDDMTIVGPDGTAVCFPKPLTISAHTLRAVHADDLTRAGVAPAAVPEPAALQGRPVDRADAEPLQPADHGDQRDHPDPGAAAEVQRRPARAHASSPARPGSRSCSSSSAARPGWPTSTTTTRSAGCSTNTDDAYGFPPFKYFASAVTIGGRGYRELREREEEILRSFLSHVRARVLASDTFGWADEIPRLLRADAAARATRVGGTSRAASGPRS